MKTNLKIIFSIAALTTIFSSNAMYEDPRYSQKAVKELHNNIARQAQARHNTENGKPKPKPEHMTQEGVNAILKRILAK